MQYCRVCHAMSPTTLILLWLCSTFVFEFQHVNVIIATPTSNPTDIHDLLPQYGFPKGLLPNNVASYTLPSSDDGFFTVQLQSPCYVHFSDQLVYYHSLITGYLSYGSVSGVSGIQAKMLFLWLPVTGITVHHDSDMLEFFVGALSQNIPATRFQRVPGCSPKACKGSATTILVDRMWSCEHKSMAFLRLPSNSV